MRIFSVPRITIAAFATAVACVAWQTAASAATTTATMTLDQDVLTCTGTSVHISGQLLGVFTFNANAAGGFTIATHVQPQGVQGVDGGTGTKYLATGLTRDGLVVTPGGTSSFSFLNHFHIQATRGSDGFDVMELVHVTSFADGSISAFVDHLSVSC